jgi:hypothetical protein
MRRPKMQVSRGSVFILGVVQKLIQSIYRPTRRSAWWQGLFQGLVVFSAIIAWHTSELWLRITLSALILHAIALIHSGLTTGSTWINNKGRIDFYKRDMVSSSYWIAMGFHGLLIAIAGWFLVRSFFGTGTGQ